MGPRSRYEEIKPLSAARAGGQNKGIYLVKSKSSGRKYIEKRLGTTQIRMGYGDREVRAMQQCNHPNVIQIKDWDLDYTYYGYGSIYMARCELGSLGDMIKRFRLRMKRLEDEGFLWKVAFDCTLALCHLWTGASADTIRRCARDRARVDTIPGWNRIVHRDLKPDNIFLTWENCDDKCLYPNAVVGDFGCSVSIKDINAGRAKGFAHHSGMTPAFDLPESPVHDDKGDVYQLGLILHCLGRMINEPMRSFTERAEAPLPLSLEGSSLDTILKMCLRKDPRQRRDLNDLPSLVIMAYTSWRKTRKNDGAQLPGWAFG